MRFVLKAAIFVGLAAILFYVRDIVLAVLTAVVIASSLDPFVRRMVRSKIPRTGAVLIVYALVMLVLLGCGLYIIPTLATELTSFFAVAPSYLGGLTLQSETVIALQSAANDLAASAAAHDYTAAFLTVLSLLGSTSFEVGTAFVSGISIFILILVLSFYLNTQEDGVGDFLRIVTPMKYESYVIGLWRRSQRNISRWMQGQVFLALLVGIFTYGGLSILGVRHALLLALITAFCEIIPVFGPIFGAIPGIFVGFLTGGISTALLVVALYVIIQQLESHIMYPIVVRKLVGVPPLVVIIALVIGLKLGGLLGGILSIPLATVFIEYINDRERGRRTDRRSVAAYDMQ